MVKIPIFKIFGDGNPKIDQSILPNLPLRDWTALDIQEKEIVIQELINRQWISQCSEEVLKTIHYLNYTYLRLCPGKNLHNVKPEYTSRGNINRINQEKAAYVDFQEILRNESNNSLVYVMLSVFLKYNIKEWYIDDKETSSEEMEKNISNAYADFDKLANLLNHSFEQFSINVYISRNGLIPKQDNKIIENIYIPTLQILSNIKWRTVNKDLIKMFKNFNDGEFSETITMAHRALQRFLQILVGKEGKNSKGEMSKLFREAKKQNLISNNRFIEPIFKVFENFLPAERATKSTAKPTKSDTTSSDALLVMNVVMISIQHILQHV